MGVPIGFEPDPDIPDADLLGYGWLHYDDGSSPRWLDGDAELAALVGRYQDHVQHAQTGVTDDGAPTDPTAAPEQQQPGGQTIGGALAGLFGSAVGDRGRPASNPQTNLFGGFPSNGQPDPTDVSSPESQALSQSPGAPPAGTAPAAAPTAAPTDIAPQNASFALPPPMAGAGGAAGGAAGGLQPYERQGRLPDDLVSAQAAERATSFKGELGAFEQSRNAQSKAYRDANDAELGRLQAQKKQSYDDWRDGQNAIDRYDSDRQRIIDEKIGNDLYSVQGPGSILSVFGAALLGAYGNQEGLRFINNQIDRHVKNQLAQKDSKLRILADQIGSERQAMLMAKARYYELLGKEGDAMTKQAGFDAYDAQTPWMLEQMRVQHMQNEEAAQKEAIGKLTEKVPPPAKGPTPQQIEGYGKEEQALIKGERAFDRMALAVGAVIDKKTGRVINADELRKNGIEGVGVVREHLADILNDVSLSDKGREVAGAIHELIGATAKDQNGNRGISDKDIPFAARTMGMLSPQGVINALERHYAHRQEDHFENIARFGLEAARQYHQTLGALGARDQSYSTPGESSVASLDEKQALLEHRQAQRASGGGEQQQQASGGDEMKHNGPEVMSQVRGELTGKYGQELGPEGIAILAAQAAHETGGGAHFVGDNIFGHKAQEGQPFVEAETGEGTGGKEKIMAKFRKYASVAEAVDDHVALIKKIPGAWAALQLGDPHAFAAALKDAHYYTDSEENYVGGILRAMHEQ